MHSQSTSQILGNRATEKGGGIYASQLSSINQGLKSLKYINQTSNISIYFYGNRARQGGGLYLESNSVVYYTVLCTNNIINFDKNSADYGGAVYVYTESPSKLYYPYQECFFQSFQNLAQWYNITIETIKCNKQDKPFHFSLNRASYSASSLYKDAFNHCRMYGRLFGEFELLSTVCDIQTSDIGSSLVVMLL